MGEYSKSILFLNENLKENIDNPDPITIKYLGIIYNILGKIEKSFYYFR